MTRDDAIRRLEEYEREVRGVLSRFVHTSSSLSIAGVDQSKLHQIVIEIHDLFEDFLGSNNPYGPMIVKTYNEGTTNYYGTSSYSSVQSIIAALAAALVRIKSNVSLGATATPIGAQTSRTPLPLPEKVTLKWLVEHVPVSVWLMAGGVVVSSFLLGVAAAKLSIVQEWFGITAPQNQGSRK